LGAANWLSEAPENLRTVCNLFRLSKDPSCEPYIGVKWANGLQQQLHLRYFCTATYWQRTSGLLIYQQVNYIQQMLKHNDWCTGLDYMAETVKFFNLLLAADKQGYTRRAHLLPLDHWQKELFFHPVSH
jgi:hypothetical protein